MEITKFRKVVLILLMFYSIGMTLVFIGSILFFAYETKIQARMAKDFLKKSLVFEDGVPSEQRIALRSSLNKMIRMMEQEDNDEVRLTFIFPLTNLPSFYYKDRSFSQEETTILLKGIELGERTYKLRDSGP